MSQSRFPSHPKTRGEIAEALFIAKALSLGFIVSKPFGDNAPYDFILGYGKRLFRVQIKSAWASWNGGCQFVTGCLRGRVRPYRSDELDFIIAYIAPDLRQQRRTRRNTSDHGDVGVRGVAGDFLGTWFIIPAAKLRHIKSLHLRAKPSSRSKYEPFRESWHLLQQRQK